MKFIKKYLLKGDIMLKLLKYELMGTRKFMLGTILFALGASTGLQLSLKNRIDEVINQGRLGNETFTSWALGILILMLIGAYIASLVYIISSFRKELYEDRGYLTFSLPITGTQLLGSKLIVSLLWVSIISFGVFFYNIGLSSILFSDQLVSFRQLLNAFIQIEGIGNMGLFLLVSSLVGSLLTLLLIYFSITVSKISLKGRTIGSLWVVLFLILNYIYTFLYDKISEIFPVYVDIQSFKIIGEREIFLRTAMSNNPVINFIGAFPIVSSTFSVFVIVLVFMLTGYLLDKKVELE